MKGYVEAIRSYFYDEGETKKVIAKYLRDSDPEVLDAAYRGLAKPVAKNPYPTIKEIQFHFLKWKKVSIEASGLKYCLSGSTQASKT